MNKVILMGRLTRDVEMFGQKSKVARFCLAVDRTYGEDETDFFNCVSFGKQAEFVEKYLKKGSKVLISGRVQNDNYTNKEGQKVYSVQILVEEIEFAESKGNNTETQPVQQQSNDYVELPESLPEELSFN